MLYKPILLVDETFHQAFFSSYKVTVLLSEKQMDVAYFDFVRKKYIYFFSQQSDEPFDVQSIKKILKEQFISEQNFKIRFIIATSHVQILPNSFSMVDNEKLINRFVFDDNESKVNRCPSLFESVLLYSIPNEVNEVLADYSSSAIFPHIHATLHLANLYLKKSKLKSEVFVHLHESFFEAIVLDNERLILSNTYSFQHFDDILYYIHLLYKTLSLSLEQFPLIFSGQLEKKDELIKKMKEFNFNTEFAKLNHSYIYSYRFNELTAHRHASLFSIPYENY
jgi:hypothetical protein